jgi:hypothetical protein
VEEIKIYNSNIMKQLSAIEAHYDVQVLLKCGPNKEYNVIHASGGI